MIPLQEPPQDSHEGETLPKDIALEARLPSLCIGGGQLHTSRGTGGLILKILHLVFENSYVNLGEGDGYMYGLLPTTNDASTYM